MFLTLNHHFFAENGQISKETPVLGFLQHALFSLGPVYEFVCISFRTDNLNCFRAS
jgi:hypothetical protein